MRVHRVVLGLIAGLVIGSIIGASQNPAALRVVGAIEPVGRIWINAIQMTIVPLVVSLLFVAVAERSANDRIGRTAGVTVAMFFVLLAFAAVVALALGPSLMRDMKLSPEAAAALRSNASVNASGVAARIGSLPGLGAWFTSLVPANPIAAAASGAMLPLIVFTLVLALATRQIDEPLRASLLGFFRAVASATTRIVEWVIAAAPVGIFALVLADASRVGVALAGAMAYYVLAISATLALFALLIYPVASIGGRRHLGAFIRAAVPSQAVALGTSSSLASLPALVEGGVALGLSAEATGFVLPLSVSTFKVATPITWMIGTLFLARLYGVALGGFATLSIAVTAVALSLTIPGVPQGAQLLLAPVLAGYGIPPEGVALLIAVDTIPDLVGTMTNVTGDLVVATVVSARAGETTVAESVSQVASSADA
ncbi:MAG TPA: cation:dicarboxylase symporter family transporter [Gemmatimonadaceae bacterium]|nr:cation:dicarboxylase symporter family transporter [Gemmatimonadaceae bacterium]